MCTEDIEEELQAKTGGVCQMDEKAVAVRSVSVQLVGIEEDVLSHGQVSYKWADSDETGTHRGAMHQRPGARASGIDVTCGRLSVSVSRGAANPGGPFT
jgi:hypothetical protein